jgi:hypothetical protein
VHRPWQEHKLGGVPRVPRVPVVLLLEVHLPVGPGRPLVVLVAVVTAGQQGAGRRPQGLRPPLALRLHSQGLPAKGRRALRGRRLRNLRLLQQVIGGGGGHARAQVGL